MWTKIKSWLQLIRVRQWYKNLLIFLPLFFSGNLLAIDKVGFTLVGFAALCLISSADYILNDLVDLDKDRKNPEKAHRPLAKGAVSKIWAGIISGVFIAAAICIGTMLNWWFLGCVLGIFLLGTMYTLYWKNVLFLDVLTLAVLFVIRAVSGAFIINVHISPWLILCPFFLALFLAIGKRHSEALLLKNRASATRKVLAQYNAELTNTLMIISTTLLIISYALYSFLSEHNLLLLTLPIALFVIFRFFYFISSGSDLARHPERAIKDYPLVAGVLLWIASTFVLIYLV